MTEKSSLFALLEKNFLTYQDLKDMPVAENGEAMISLSGTGIHSTVCKDIITPSTGDDIHVREGLLPRLRKAQDLIAELFPGHVLDIVYGYRSLKVQTDTYERIKSDIAAERPDLDPDALDEAVHRFIAVPIVAGHPTGGAVDVRILNAQGLSIDMGTDVQEFVKESYSFYPSVTRTVWLHRQKLRQAMLSAGFAPFDGEWWHFSYGDKEWARYYEKPCAIYNQIDFEVY